MRAIQLYDIWKRYYIDYRRRSSKEFFLDYVKRPDKKNEFWALKGVFLEVDKGQTLGVIGNNGSGKSTLLKLLCSVTNPTRGFLKVNGKVAGLLDLCAGFQGDLTGKENIHLNCSLLGMSRKDIKEKIDFIVDFADLGDFIEAPVRTYSNGMYLRLGFAITIGVDMDILLIDEALAVGDETFQQRCLRKIEELKNEGRTMVFVSHNFNMIKELCERVILIDHGRIISDGDPEDSLRFFSLREDQRVIKQLQI